MLPIADQQLFQPGVTDGRTCRTGTITSSTTWVIKSVVSVLSAMPMGPTLQQTRPSSNANTCCSRVAKSAHCRTTGHYQGESSQLLTCKLLNELASSS